MNNTNTILLVSSDFNKKQIFLNSLKNNINYFYIKLENLIPVVSDTLNKKLTGEQYIDFFNVFFNKLEKKQGTYIIDINNCKEQSLINLVNNKNIFIVSLDYLFNINNCSYIDTSQNLEEQINTLIRRL